MRISLSALGLSTIAACGNSGAGVDTEGSADAAPKSCTDYMPLTIGHCVDMETDAPCLDFSAEGRQFIPLPTSDPVHPVVGLQGSPMFVLAVQAEGIVNGENEFAPLVNLEVKSGDDFVGGFSSRPVFVAGDSDKSLRAPQLYVVSFYPDDQIGTEVQVQAEIEDREGQIFCHTDTFVIGTLVDAPPLP